MTPIQDLDLTILPLDEFRQVMGIDPWHFWQMGTMNGCQGPYTHYPWIGTGPGRYDFIQALLMAERQLAQKLEFWPGPRYDENEEIRMIKPRQPVLYNRTPMQLQARWRHVVRTGKRTWTLLSANEVPDYTSVDSATMTIAVPATVTADQVAVCYRGTYNQIRPIRVDIVAGQAFISIKKWLMADPVAWEYDDVIDPTNIGNLLGLVDIYQVTYDSELALLLAWEPEIQGCGCLDSDCVVCANATHLACTVRGDYKNGSIGWQTAEPTGGVWYSHRFPSTRFPDLAYLNYVHGAELESERYMSRYWAQIVSHFAVTFLQETPCGCSDTNNGVSYWMQDLGLVKDTSHNLGPSDIDNPYGTRRGQIGAWRAVLMHIGD